MRINVYSQELTSETRLISKTSNTGLVYSAVQLLLHSSPMLHHPGQTKCAHCAGPASPDTHNLHMCSHCDGRGFIENDDDRSAVTIWLPKSRERRTALAAALRDMALYVLQAPPETGLD